MMEEEAGRVVIGGKPTLEMEGEGTEKVQGLMTPTMGAGEEEGW